MPYLPFIDDGDLKRHLETMVSAVVRSKQSVESNPFRVVIDPFSALVDASVQGIGYEEWLAQEKARKIQKSLQNALGDFHQNILGSIHNWTNAGLGGSYDVENADSKIIAEIKNKYNTLNSEGLLSVYDKLANHLDFGKRGYTAFYVAVVPKNAAPYNEPFTPVMRRVQRPRREDLRKIDGASFYSLATGDKDALKQLYDVLPVLLQELGYQIPSGQEKSFQDLFSKAFVV